MTCDHDPAAFFHARRPRLQRIAYRMLGSKAEAEDVVQDAWLRWHGADRGAIHTPDAFLVTTVTRLCLDVLKSARVRRAQYIGPWLPDPVIDPDDGQDDDITLPLMLALERLSPLERAAFLLHDVFDLDFDEVAAAIGRAPAACRQLASRARVHVAAARPRFPVTPDRQRDIAAAFFAASRSGDVAQLTRLLSEDVMFHGDGGGKRAAVMHPIVGREKVLRFLLAPKVKAAWDRAEVLQMAGIDGLPGRVTRENDALLQTMALEIDDGRIKAIYVMRNPDKLAHLEQAAPAG